MGSPLSPILVDLVIQDLECIFKTLTIHISLYYCYVDDIIIAAPNEHINTILCSFNSSIMKESNLQSNMAIKE